MMLALGYVLLGISLLAISGDKLVVGGVAIAERLKLSRVFVGVVILGFGTSLPEVVTSISAAASGAPLLLLGNIIGSNIANIGLPLGLALLLYKDNLRIKDARTDLYLMLFSYFVLGIAIIWGDLGMFWGETLIALLLVSIHLSLKTAQKTPVVKKELQQEVDETPLGLSTLQIYIFILGGLVGLVVGANLLVDGATTIARAFGVSERIIGLTLVALGTSLPEVAASLAAVRRKEIHVVVGNVLGSNLFNIFAGIGAGALITTLPMEQMRFDYILMLIISVLLAPIFFKNPIHSRVMGGVMVLAYGAYITFLTLQG